MELKNRTQYVELWEKKAVIVEAANLSRVSGVFVHMYLTMGELLALKNALDSYDTRVGEDVRAYIN